jgi:hypothetical protein
VLVEGGDEVDRAGMLEGAVLLDQVGQGGGRPWSEHRCGRPVLDFDECQAGDGVEVLFGCHAERDVRGTAPSRGRLDAVAALASESEVG